MSTQTLSFFDPERNITIDVELSPEDALKAQTDMVFATSIMTGALREQEEEGNMVVETFESESLSTSSIASTDNGPEAGLEEGDGEDGGIFNVQINQWTTPCVKLLLATYKSMEEKFSTSKKPQKKIWEDISQILNKNGYNVSGPQCAAKLRSLKKTYKSVKDHNNVSGNDNRTWQFYDLMDEIFGKKAWCEPVALASSSGMTTNRKHGVSESESTSKPSTVASLLAKRIKQKEEHEAHRAERHKEKMEMDEKFLRILEKIANK